jgi:hypothetical protein
MSLGGLGFGAAPLDAAIAMVSRATAATRSEYLARGGDVDAAFHMVSPFGRGGFLSMIDTRAGRGLP